jgi:hypothetical protein
MPTSYEWSISYTNGLFFLTEDTETTWYAWTIDDGAVSVEDNDTAPIDFLLEQNYPNPFNPSTTINYAVPEESFIELKVFDALGEEITSLVSETKESGFYNVTFDAANYNSGVYFYQLRTGNFIETKKMILMK